jgi:endonuclease G
MVLETPRETANRRRRLDPLVGGISIGSPRVPVGTLGALVWDRTDGSVCILSNWHVLAGDANAEVGTPCFQPGLFDQGRSSDVVARLKRWSFNRQTDAAIAELTGNRHYCAGEIVELFQQISGEISPYLGMKVLKSGRSTGRTWGFIDGLYFSAAIEYSNGAVRVFEEQIHIAPLPSDDKSEPIRPISQPGDSGSVWVTETASDGYKAVGLHFAGDLLRSAFGEYALANPMCIVAKRLDFSFRPLFLEVRDDDVVPPPPPRASQTMQLQLSNGAEPMRLVIGGLTGSGSQPDPVQPGGGG